jgi:hypothetical protein
MKWSMVKSCRVAIALALVLVMAQFVTAVPIATDTATATIGSGSRVVNYTVDVAVWTMTAYQAENPTFELTAGNYVYEYVVKNNASQSTVSLSMFQVFIDDPCAINDVTTVGTVGGVPADAIIQDASTFPSAAYFFDLRPSLTPGRSSIKLVYTSDYGPSDGKATIGGNGGIGGEMAMLVPVPEPVSALTLAIGGLALIRKRSHKTVTA